MPAAFAREPARAIDTTTSSVPPPREVVAMLRGRFGLFGPLLVGAGLCQVPAYALAAWMPHYLGQRFHFDIKQAGLTYGTIGMVASVGGTLVLPHIAERLRQKGRLNAFALCSGVAALLGVIAMTVAGLVDGVAPFLAAVAIGLFLLTGATNNIFAAFQLVVPARMRATMAALCLMSITLLGLGIGPPVLALFNGGATAPAAAPGITALALGAALPGAACLLWCAARRRNWS